MRHEPFWTRRALLAGAAQLAAALALPRLAWASAVPLKMTVVREPTCGCCGDWAKHVRAAGFTVEMINVPDISPFKARFGIPDDLASCHTAEIGGYVVEGHVPADAIKRLLAERPQATGIAVGGMPLNSPGMEVPGAEPETYEVTLFSPGRRRVFARYRGLTEIK